ncbi:ATP-dependent RNA helicase dbp10 [Ceratobasidium sp. 428]|nr:ATP-dependent RNA helicase dbp10 [Ceratobasidium sp. 428]
MTKRSSSPNSESSGTDSDISGASKDQVDIFGALAITQGSKGKGNQVENSDNDDEEFIQRAIERHNKKSGTEVTKAVSSKGKLSKGAVGGGSFQSMGEPE